MFFPDLTNDSPGSPRSTVYAFSFSLWRLSFFIRISPPCTPRLPRMFSPSIRYLYRLRPLCGIQVPPSPQGCVDFRGVMVNSFLFHALFMHHFLLVWADRCFYTQIGHRSNSVYLSSRPTLLFPTIRLRVCSCCLCWMIEFFLFLKRVIDCIRPRSC